MTRGPLFMLGATVAFTAMVSFVKHAQTAYGMDPVALMVWRSLLTIPLGWLLARHALRGLQVQAKGWLLARTILGFFAMMSHYNAAGRLPIGELSVLFKFQPLFIAGIAPLLLGKGERPGRWLLGALVLGFVGCAVMVSPDLGASPDGVHVVGVMWAIASALFSALAHTCLRALGRTEDPRVVVFWFQIAVGVYGLLWLAADPSQSLGVPSTLAQFGVLCAIGLTAICGQLLMTEAYRRTKAAKVAGITYAGTLLGFAIDIVAFGTWPTAVTLLGAMLVLAAGWFVVRPGSGA